MIPEPVLTTIIEMWEEIGKKSHIRVSGSSMKPLIKDGSILIVDHANLDRITVGDIIIFKTDDKIVAHRVVWKNKDIITKGDSALIFDSSEKKILGKVTSIEKDKKIINLEKWRLINSLIARYSYFCAILYKKLRNLKIKVFGENDNLLTKTSSKTLSLTFYFFPYIISKLLLLFSSNE